MTSRQEAIAGHRAGGVDRVSVAWVLAMLAGVSVVAPGCGGGDARPPLIPVEGRVEVGGQPASGAFVVFHEDGRTEPSEESPSAVVQPDGSYALTTRDAGDGAPAGVYRVTVQWRKLTRDGDETKAGPDLVPPRYQDPASTPLKVTVNEGSKTLPTLVVERARRR